MCLKYIVRHVFSGCTCCTVVYFTNTVVVRHSQGTTGVTLHTELELNRGDYNFEIPHIYLANIQ